MADSKKEITIPALGELAANLTGAALDAGESDCRIALSGAAAAIKMQSKKRLPATWLAGDCMNIHISPNQDGQLAVFIPIIFLAIKNLNCREILKETFLYCKIAG